MRKICSLSFIFFSFFNSAFAQLLMNESFDAFATGSLSGKGAWVYINGSTLVINVASASPITGCIGGSGNYVQPGTASAFTTERLSYPTTNFLASTSQVFYLSFLLNLSSFTNCLLLVNGFRIYTSLEWNQACNFLPPL